ncbi:hypothetical protein [Lysobacter sp. CA199]|uniref:hypothetical protein n=1 Tax=Lysobacter sp. CA199 TaxID=3455608 RepID=UPI003F8D80A2
MDTLWPWLTIAGLGALHGLNPANGWMFAAARGGDDARVRRAMLPIAIGHAVSIAMVVFAAAQGILFDRSGVQRLAGVVLIALAAYRALRRFWPRMPKLRLHATDIGARAGPAALAVWSCLMATAHGAGLMLLPALLPLCMSDTPAREIVASGSLVLALAAISVHLAVMLVITGVIAAGVGRGVDAQARRFGWLASDDAWTLAQALVGVCLLRLG